MKIRNEGRAALEFALCVSLLFAATALPSCGHDHVPPVPPSPPPLPPPAPNPPPVDDVSAALLELHNAERAKKSLPPLRIDPKLTTAAVAHSRHMAQVGKLAHFGINDGDPWSRMKDAGYSFSSASENVAWGQPDPKTAVSDWMSSSGHRANILGNFVDAGFGVRISRHRRRRATHQGSGLCLQQRRRSGPDHPIDHKVARDLR
jgi:uncharacterized protein YkwD